MCWDASKNTLQLWFVGRYKRGRYSDTGFCWFQQWLTVFSIPNKTFQEMENSKKEETDKETELQQKALEEEKEKRKK